MHRRTLLSGVVAIVGTAAGCVAPSGGSGESTPTGTTGSTDDSSPSSTATPTVDGTPSATVTGFESTGECGDPGTADVQVLESYPIKVVVTGCIVGKNGCMVPRLHGYRYDASAGELTVVVETVKDRDGGEVCTQALVHLGYRAEFSVEASGFQRVVVVHDGAHGRRVVARVEA